MLTEMLEEARVDRAEVVQNSLDYTLFSWSKQAGLNPIAIERGEGVYLYDYSGKRYLDFSSGLMNVNIGHGNQRVTKAVAQQMQQVSYVTPSCVTKARGDLGKKLAEITPEGLTKTLFTVCGSEGFHSVSHTRWRRGKQAELLVCLQVAAAPRRKVATARRRSLDTQASSTVLGQSS